MAETWKKLAFKEGFLDGWTSDKILKGDGSGSAPVEIDPYTDSDAVSAAKADVDISDAISKKHSQNTDTHLGTVDQDISLNTHKLTNVVDPVDDQDAATKKYVDDESGVSQGTVIALVLGLGG